MDAILISTQPKWCESIAEGILITAKDCKTIEVRKTRPQVKVPFKCFIYCTKSGAGLLQTVYVPMHVVGRGYNNIKLACYKDYNYVKDMHDCVNGKVIGEFICDRIDEYAYDIYDGVNIDDDDLLETRLDREEINIYAKGKTLYGLHITDLKIYDTPKELSEFARPLDRASCGYKDCGSYDSGRCTLTDRVCEKRKITRPPQSWCFVEAI